MSSPKERELLNREANILQQLSHPAIPKGFDFLTAGSGKGRSFYIVQEFIKGESLLEEQKKRHYTEKEILKIGEEILDILNNEVKRSDVDSIFEPGK